MRFIRKIYQFFVDIPVKKGTVLNDRYEVLRVIGTGSYGIVYLCKDRQTKEKKVVKQLRPSKHSSKKEIGLFEGEISVLRTLRHNNMPIFYESFSDNNYFFYVMSLIEGENLEEQIFLNKKTFTEQESLQFLVQLLGLIDYLHKKGICHQDLRIPNILIKNKELFLIDFGLANQTPPSLLHKNHEGFLEMKQQDYYYLGEILLYLLYTTYSSNNKKALPWTEELSLEKGTVYLLKRLLGIKEPYSNISDILADLHAALNIREVD